MASSEVGYLGLLRDNPRFRRLWLGQVVSELGDWFHAIALYTLILRLTGSGEAAGALLVAQFLPGAFIGPWAGVVVDRLPRRQVMIAADLARAGVTLLFLLVREPGQVWLAYAATVAMVCLSSFFEPARSALIPRLTRREELLAANALGSVTWSTMLAVGAALGGAVAGALGTDGAFLLDSASFGISALLIASIRVDEPAACGPGLSAATRWGELREALSYLQRQKDVALYAATKGLWSLGGGIMLLLALFGREVFPLGIDGATSIGLLYAARGVGAGLGPVLARQVGGTSVTFLRRAIGPAFLFTASGYALLSWAPSLGWAAAAVVLAHVGGSIQWVFSTLLLQLHVPDRLLGRVFAVELTLLTLTTALSSYLTGLAADAGWPPRELARAVALVFVLPGLALAWLLWPARPERLPRAPTLEEPAGPEVPGPAA
ncbi:MAG TPA: MFS transporter [Candidatus Nitrosotenuis sp.]|jgi:MFS family permease|nr:MFS transporter [Candidatus Nitrosotenuis sp.]